MNSIKRTIFLSNVLFLLASCAVTATPVTGSNGKQAYSMKCSGYMRDRQDCLIKAGQLCSSGYDVLDDNSRTNGAMVAGNTILVAHSEYMTVSCK